MNQALEIAGLHKDFPKHARLGQFLRHPLRRERVVALAGIDLAVTPGTIAGLLGPNGAGKTTLMKCIAGLVLPSKGKIQYGGLTPGAQCSAARVGYVVSDERSFWWRLTVRENLRFFAALHGVTGSEFRNRCPAWLASVELEEHADRSFQSLSTGMRQRLALVRGLLSDPLILLLDEPTRSLDPESANQARALVRALVQRRPDRILLYATHNLREAEDLCSQVFLLRHGRLVAERDLRAPRARLEYVLRLRAPAGDELLGRLARCEGVMLGARSGRQCELSVDRLERLDAVVDLLRASGCGIEELAPRRDSLEQWFFEERGG